MFFAKNVNETCIRMIIKQIFVSQNSIITNNRILDQQNYT